MALIARTMLTLDEVLLGVFDDYFGLSDSESSEGKRENVYAYSGKHNLARGEVVTLSKKLLVVSLLKIITILVNLVLCLLFLRLVMTVVVRMIIRKSPWSLLVSTPCI